jgi:hypothetical protein
MRRRIIGVGRVCVRNERPASFAATRSMRKLVLVSQLCTPR